MKGVYFLIAVVLIFVVGIISFISSHYFLGFITKYPSSNSGTLFRCYETDGGINFTLSGTTSENAYGASSSETQVKEKTDHCVTLAPYGVREGGKTLEEFYCNSNNRLASTFYTCPGGCKDGACTPALCEPSLESDNGLNSVLFGELRAGYSTHSFFNFWGDELPPVIARDACVNSSLLKEYYCESRKDEQTGEFYGVVSTQLIPCPYDCDNGICLLGPASTFCDSNYGCINLDAGTMCLSRNSEQYNPDLIFTGSDVRIYLSDFSSYRTFSSYCNNDTSFVSFECAPFTPVDDWHMPVSNIVSCSDGYFCSAGKCFEIPSSFSSLRGDVDGNGVVDMQDLTALNSVLFQNPVQYSSVADIDRDGLVTSYDSYLLSYRLSKGSFPLLYTARNFTLFSSSPFSSDSTFGNLTEFFGTRPIYTWNVSHELRGASRRNCVDPELKINLKNVNKNTRIVGMSSAALSGQIHYDEFKMTPDCDIWGLYSVDNLLREYTIYSTLRKNGLPVFDVIGFANVHLDVNGSFADPSSSYHYLLSQRPQSDKDELPFLAQFGYREYIDSNKNLSDVISFNPFNMIFNSSGTVHAISFERNNTLRSIFLLSLFSVGDRGSFHNEDYALRSDGMWDRIYYDFDLSFNCDLPYNLDISDTIQSSDLSASEKEEVSKKAYLIAREIFDNENVLHNILLSVDKYPFLANKNRFKREITLRFLRAALYYGSPAFADSLNVQYAPFSNEAKYLSEAEQVLRQQRSFGLMCPYQLDASNIATPNVKP